jgi:ATP-dependent DNA ligase
LTVENAILDGEMIVLDEDAKPFFEYVMEWFQARKESGVKQLLNVKPAVFMAFDVLYATTVRM